MNTNVGGVYLILNTINGKGYIGSSNNIKTRFRWHKNELLKNKHCNDYLQNSYNKYGKEAFTYTILQKIDDFSKLREIELDWINKLQTINPSHGYNICLPNITKEGVGLHGESTKEKIRRKRYENIFGEFNEEKYIDWKNNLKPRNIPQPTKDMTVIVFDYVSGEKVGEYSSPMETSKVLNCSRKKITAVLNGERLGKGTKIARSYKNFIFKYKRDIKEGEIYKKLDYRQESKIIQVFNRDNILIKEGNNAKQLALELGLNHSTIGYALSANKLVLVAKSYYFKYKASTL